MKVLFDSFTFHVNMKSPPNSLRIGNGGGHPPLARSGRYACVLAFERRFGEARPECRTSASRPVTLKMNINR